MCILLYYWANKTMMVMMMIHIHPFNGLFPGLPGWAGTRKVNLDFTGARDSEWQWQQLGHMQVCTSLQTDNHINTSSLNVYRPDALPDAQPTVSKHCRIRAMAEYAVWTTQTVACEVARPLTPRWTIQHISAHIRTHTVTLNHDDLLSCKYLQHTTEGGQCNLLVWQQS